MIVLCKLLLSNVCLHCNGHFSRWIWVSRYQNVLILDLVGAKDDGDGGDNWSCKTCKAHIFPPTNQHPAFHRPDVCSLKYVAVAIATLWRFQYFCWYLQYFFSLLVLLRTLADRRPANRGQELH